jgi:reactive intermediate/imine deaminase
LSLQLIDSIDVNIRDTVSMTKPSRRHGGRTDQAPHPVGAYSQSARVGAIVHAAGQSGHDPVTGDLSDDVAAQTRQCLRNVEQVLLAGGATLDDVVRVGVFLARNEDFEAMDAAYREMFAEPFPARTTVMVGLPLGLRVEIDALAVVADAADAADPVSPLDRAAR